MIDIPTDAKLHHEVLASLSRTPTPYPTLLEDFRPRISDSYELREVLDRINKQIVLETHRGAEGMEVSISESSWPHAKKVLQEYWKSRGAMSIA